MRLAALLVSIALAGCAAHPRPAPPPSFSAPPVVHDLASLRDLAARFDRDRAHPRVVLLLSPT